MANETIWISFVKRGHARAAADRHTPAEVRRGASGLYFVMRGDTYLCQDGTFRTRREQQEAKAK